MLILGIIVMGILLAISIFITLSIDFDDHPICSFVMGGIAGIFGIIEIVIIICLPFCISDTVKLGVCDKKIAMYQEENENIQNQVNQIISNYKEYEQDTFSKSIENINLENTDVVVLAQLYPELKSNEMVNNQINIYQENNKKIKEIKEEKINKQISKWWLYFESID